jgi:hypothetical protein
VSALPSRDLDDEFQQAFPDEDAEAVQGSFVDTGTDPTGAYQEGEYYPYDESSEYEIPYGPRPLSRLGRLGYIAGALLLLAACGLFAFVMVTRILPQASPVTGVQATQTALAAIRPAVNTPIAQLPTAEVLPSGAPTSEVVPPTNPPAAQPTDTLAPGVEVLPTSTSIPPAPTTQPNSTAPPPQDQPTGGIIESFMTSEIPAGDTLETVGVYDPSSAFVLAVQAQFGAGGVTSVVTRWYGPDNGLLFEMPRDFAQAGTYYSTFTLRKNTPWLEGAYRVDIYTNGSASPGYSVSFSVAP